MSSERFISPNLAALNVWRNQGKRGGVLEGSSRSIKTWSSVDFIVQLTSQKLRNKTINIVKETYNSFKTTLFEDFNRRLPMYGIPSPFADKKDLQTFWLFGNRINLLGADSDTVLHGVGSDIVYFNEFLDIPRKAFDQMEMRCRDFWWADYNPKFVDHWVYDAVCNRPDVGFLKTTFMDNPFLSQAERSKILSYEPWHPEDRHIQDTKLRREHPSNVKAGTADEYMWNVYGLGLRSAPQGLVFQNVVWVKEFPKNIERVYYGMDFGYTEDPATVVKLGVNGHNLYIEKLWYGPILNATEFEPILLKLGLKDVNIWADSADPGFISDLNRLRFHVYAVKKFAGSINYGIGLLKKYKIHLVDSPEFRREQSQYVYREHNGKRLDEPIDAHNHLWDPSRYAAIMNLRQT